MDVNSELREAQLEIVDADYAYSGNRKGLIWFNRTANKVKAIYNSAVQILASEEYVSSEIASAISGSEGSLESTGLITNERSDPTTPASGKAHLYAKTDGIYYKDDGGAVEKLIDSSQAVLDRIDISQSPIPINGTIGGTLAEVVPSRCSFEATIGRTYVVSFNATRLASVDAMQLYVVGPGQVDSLHAEAYMPGHVDGNFFISKPYTALGTGTYSIRIIGRNWTTCVDGICFVQEA